MFVVAPERQTAMMAGMYGLLVEWCLLVGLYEGEGKPS
jgi:hypothetical protein